MYKRNGYDWPLYTLYKIWRFPLLHKISPSKNKNVESTLYFWSSSICVFLLFSFSYSHFDEDFLTHGIENGTREVSNNDEKFSIILFQDTVTEEFILIPSRWVLRILSWVLRIFLQILKKGQKKCWNIFNWLC